MKKKKYWLGDQFEAQTRKEFENKDELYIYCSFSFLLYSFNLSKLLFVTLFSLFFAVAAKNIDYITLCGEKKLHILCILLILVTLDDS